MLLKEPSVTPASQGPPGPSPVAGDQHAPLRVQCPPSVSRSQVGSAPTPAHLGSILQGLTSRVTSLSVPPFPCEREAGYALPRHWPQLRPCWNPPGGWGTAYSEPRPWRTNARTLFASHAAPLAQAPCRRSPGTPSLPAAASSHGGLAAVNFPRTARSCSRKILTPRRNNGTNKIKIKKLIILCVCNLIKDAVKFYCFSR